MRRSAFSDVGFIHINTTGTGIGNGGLGYSIDANPGAARNGNIHVGAQLFAVAQAGVTVPRLQLTALDNAASYTAGEVVPGEIVTFSAAISGHRGCRSTIQFNKQSITNSLSGVQVLFDGNAAPLPMLRQNRSTLSRQWDSRVKRRRRCR